MLGDREQIMREDLPPQVLALRRAAAHAHRRRRRRRSARRSRRAGSRGRTAVTTAVTIDPGAAADGRSPRAAKSLRELEKEGILAALAATNGNKAQAAAILEIDRSTLYKKLKDYGIEG